MIMMKIYERDAYCREFTAKVISCTKNEDAFDVVLDKTAFFPEEGGQPADKGTLNNVTVFDVQEKDGVIIHKTESEISGEVKGLIDWETRFLRMQSHTAEHIISGIVHKIHGYNNVGFHLSESGLMTVDFDGALTRDDIKNAELLSNRAIWENKKVSVLFPEKEELTSLNYRSKLDLTDGVRIIEIEDTDLCACCAPHVGMTGEAGLIKVIDAYSYKGGTRVELLAGGYALCDYGFLNDENKSLMGLLSASRDAVRETVEKQAETIKAQKSEITALKNELALLKLNPKTAGDITYSITGGLTFDELRHCVNTVGADKKCMFFSYDGEGNCLYVISSKSGGVKEIVKNLNGAFNGRGGGKDDYAQGKIVATEEEIVKYIENM